MMKKKFFVVVIFLAMGIGFPSVEAAEFKIGSNRQNLYYGGTTYTIYPKYVGGTLAYCSQLNKHVPSSGVNCGATWNKYSKVSYVAGQIIDIVNAKSWSAIQKYKYIQYALNCSSDVTKVISGGHYTGMCSNSDVKAILKKAEKNVSEYKYKSGNSTDKLPAITLKEEKKEMIQVDVNNTINYISKAITLSGMETKAYGGGDNSSVPKYKIVLSSYKRGDTSTQNGTPYICSSAKYNDKCIKADKEVEVPWNKFYVYVKEATAKQKGTVSIKVSGSNSSKYLASMGWNCGGSVQKPVTKNGSVTITRTISTSTKLTFNPTNKPDEKELNYDVSLEKVDEDGNSLLGAALSMYIANSNGDKIEDLCSVDGVNNSSCNKSVTFKENESTNYVTTNQICYEETSVPSGYIKINKHCEQIQLNNEATKFYKAGETEDKEIPETEYNKYNSGKILCVKNEAGKDALTDEYIQNNLNNPEVITEGICETGDGEVDIPDESEETEKDPGAANFEPMAVIGYQTICAYSSSGTAMYEGFNRASDDDADETWKEYCSAPTLVKTSVSGGDYNFTVVNGPNQVKISKKSIGGTDELYGSTLALYTTSGGKCTNTLATAKGFSYSPFAVLEEEPPEEETGGDSSEDLDSSDDSGVDADEETSSDTNDDGINNMPDPTKGLKWISGYSSAEISGLAAGTYCLVEEIPPKGYIKSTKTTKFSVDEDGNAELIEAGDAVLDNGIIVLNDTVNEMEVSKTAMATSEELPGAKLAICETDDEKKLVVGNNGDCTVATLADGSHAIWTSGNEPHKISGLPVGTYYLVETMAPNGYTVAESIMFTMNDDGTLVDKDGKSLANNKLVMKDKTIEEVKTGMLQIFIIIGMVIVASALGIITYYRMNKNNNVNV